MPNKVNRKSNSKKADLTFPVARVKRHLERGKYSKHIQVGAAMYMAAVLEYLVAKTIKSSGDAAPSNKKVFIKPCDIIFAIKNDEELSKVLGDIVISNGCVLKHTENVLPKSSKKSSSHKNLKKN